MGNSPFTAGSNTHRLLCGTDADKPTLFPIGPLKGEKFSKSLPEALQDFHIETLLIKGTNAIDTGGNVGVIT